MRKRYRDHIRFAERIGLTDVRIIHNGTVHPRICGLYRGAPVSMAIGSSRPSDHRAIRNFRGELRRACRRALGVHIPPAHMRHVRSKPGRGA